MLIIERKINEAFELVLSDGRKVIIHLKSSPVRNDVIKFGIQAPKDIRINRLDKEQLQYGY